MSAKTFPQRLNKISSSLVLTLGLPLLPILTSITISEADNDSVQSGQVTKEPLTDTLPPWTYQSDQPVPLSPERRKAREQAMQRTHRPGPPLTIQSGTILKPTGPSSQVNFSTATDSPMAISQTSFQVFDPAFTDLMSTTAEPSVAQAGSRVFFTANWFAAQSADGGTTWSFINPYVGPFPNPPSDDGFCCDQVTIYDPAQNAIYWLQQYDQSTALGTGTQRINVDMGANGSWDCHYDWEPSDFNLGSNKWFDFPDLALSTGFLYHTTNVFSTTTGKFTNSLVARYPRNQIGTCAQNVSGAYFQSTTEGSPRVVHGAGTTMYWATHLNQNTMRIHSWADGSTLIPASDRTVSAWPQAATYSCPGPDGRNMCGKSDGRILGAYRTNGIVGFMWNASQGGSFTYPHVRMAKFNESTLALLNEEQVSNSNFAYAYPSVSVNGAGDIGGTMLFGGGTNHLGCLAWTSQGLNGGTFQPLDNIVVVQSTSGPANNRAGDYLTSRPDITNSNAFVGTCYSVQSPGASGDGRNRYVKFFRITSSTNTLTVTKAGTGTGTVTSAPAGINCGATCNASFTSGTSVTLTAIASAGSTFTAWSGGGCSGIGTCAVTLTANTTVTATFTAVPSTSTLTVVKAGAGTGTVTSAPAGINCGATCNASFTSGTSVTLTAIASAGSTFTGWSGGGCSGTGTCIVNGDTTVTATFNADSAPPSGASAPSGGGGGGCTLGSLDKADVVLPALLLLSFGLWAWRLKRSRSVH